MKDSKEIFKALRFPVIGVLLMVSIYFLETEGWIHLKQFGIRPRELKGLIGIILSPFLHGSVEHLFNNSLPILVLGWSTFYFYKELAWRTLAWIVFLGGIWVWLSARSDTNHIGASGLIYGLVTFLFFSGFLRKYKPLMAISLLMIFLYGSLVWGVLPVQEHVSWEGHLWGAIAGTVMAYYFRPAGPQRPKYEWENEDYDEDEEGPWNQFSEEQVTIEQNARPIRVVYRFKPKKKEVNPAPPSADSDGRPSQES